MTAGRLSSEVGTNARTFNHNVPWSRTVASTKTADQWSEQSNGRGRALDDVLEKLQEKEIPGKEYLVYLDSHDGGGFYAWACRRIQMEPYLEADIAILGPPLVVPTRETSFGMVKARY